MFILKKISLSFTLVTLIPAQIICQTPLEPKSIITPVASTEIIESTNIIYCVSFELAWRSLQDNIFKQPIITQTKSWLEDELNKSVNNSISPRYFVALSGFAKDSVAQKFTDELYDRFNIIYEPQKSISPHDIQAFAFLRKKLEFFTELDTVRSRKLIFSDNNNVAFFGFNSPFPNPEYNEKIKIFDYLNENDFILELSTSTGSDQVFLAKIQPKKSLLETYNHVMQRIENSGPEYFNEEDQLGIPYINFHFKKEFKELYQSRIINKGFEKYSIQRAVQIIDFNLNGKGISLESAAEFDLVFGIPQKIEVKRVLNFDKPFLIILKEKEKKQPYFLMWVSNSSLMIKKS